MLHETRKKRVKSPAIKEETALFEITFNNEISGTFISMWDWAEASTRHWESAFVVNLGRASECIPRFLWWSESPPSSSSLLGRSWRRWAAGEHLQCESIRARRDGPGPPGGDPARLTPGTAPSMSDRCLPGGASAQSSWRQWGLGAVWCTALDQNSPGWLPAECQSPARNPGDPWPPPTSFSHLIFQTLLLYKLQVGRKKEKTKHLQFCKCCTDEAKQLSGNSASW